MSILASDLFRKLVKLFFDKNKGHEFSNALLRLNKNIFPKLRTFMKKFIL